MNLYLKDIRTSVRSLQIKDYYLRQRKSLTGRKFKNSTKLNTILIQNFRHSYLTLIFILSKTTRMSENNLENFHLRNNFDWQRDCRTPDVSPSHSRYDQSSRSSLTASRRKKVKVQHVA